MAAVSQIGILAPGIVTQSPLPRRWRRQGDFIDLSAHDETGLLAHAFGLAAGDLDPAPLHYLGMTGTDPGGYCILAYPVYLHARREQLILMTGPEFEPSEREAEHLVELLRAHFPQWRVERTADAMWFIILEEDPELETTPLHDVMGENIYDHLPRGADAMRWHGLLNELQMLLFDSEVNRSREAAGRTPVNSLWLWGGGRPPAVGAVAWQRVVTDNPVARGIGRLAGIATCGLEEDDGNGIPAPGTLRVASSPGGADQGPDFRSADYWRILKSSLQRGDIDRVVLIEPGYGELAIDVRTARSWWPW